MVCPCFIAVPFSELFSDADDWLKLEMHMGRIK